jgi:hypothetical protein
VNRAMAASGWWLAGKRRVMTIWKDHFNAFCSISWTENHPRLSQESFGHSILINWDWDRDSGFVLNDIDIGQQPYQWASMCLETTFQISATHWISCCSPNDTLIWIGKVS